MSHYANKSASQIEGELEQVRTRLSRNIDTLEDRLSPGQLMDRGMDYLRHNGANEFVSNLGASVRDNPMPVAITAIGLGWLIATGARPNGSPRESSDTSAGAGAKLRDAKDRASGALSSTKERAGGTMSSTKERAGSAVSSTRDAAANAGDRARSGVNRVGQGARSSVNSLSHQARRARGQFSYLLEEQPLVLGALGIALGAALGAGMPPSQWEDERLGHTSDDVKDQASETARRQSEKLQSAAEAAGQAGADQAQREGLVSAQENKKSGSSTSHSSSATSARAAGSGSSTRDSAASASNA